MLKRIHTAHIGNPCKDCGLVFDEKYKDNISLGKDQLQHIEFSKKILNKLGFKCPVPIVNEFKVMDLNNPLMKMSKSSPNGCIFLGEDNSKKIMKAKTDEAGIENLRSIYKHLTTEKIPLSNKELKEGIIKALSIK